MSLLTLAACGGRTSEEAASSGSSSSEKALSSGQQVYTSYCVTCHQANGQGIPGAFPPLTETEWTTGDEGRLIRLVYLRDAWTYRGERIDVQQPHEAAWFSL